jgi:transcriptional regulator with XRE-family HTH domain
MQPIKRASHNLDSGIKPCDHTCVKPEFSATTAECDRGTRRYFNLIQELADEYGAPKHGWRVRVAARLGIDQSFLSRLLSGSRAIIGADSIDKAVSHLGIRRGYFEDHHDPISYGDYLGVEGEAHEPTFDGWLEFLESPIGLTVTPGERRTLASTVFEDGYTPPCAYYVAHLYLLRGLVTPAEARRGIDKAVELDARLRAHRNRP